MKIIGFVLMTFLIACSNFVETKKYSQFDRVSYLDDDEIRPEFYFSKLDKQNRAPANIGSTSIEEENEPASLRAAYFVSLWNQKKQMEAIMGSESSNHCPAFHQEVLRMNGYTTQTQSFYSFNEMFKKIKNNKNPLVYPVLALPYKGSDLYSYSESNRLEVEDIKSAFSDYYQLTVKEVDNLCETGVSQGYFMTKNLSDYYVNQESFASSEKHLVAILKTPYVANLYMINSFSTKGIQQNVGLLSNLNARWFIGYLDTLKDARNNKVVINDKQKRDL